MTQRLRSTPTNAEVLSNRSVALLTLERVDEALQSCDAALKIMPHSVDALYNRGNALRALGQPEEAGASYQEALAIEPRRADAHNNLGLTLVSLGLHAEALTHFDAALAIAPNDIGALHNRANALTELGAHQAALDPCDRVLAIDALHADAHNTRGVVLGRLRRFAEALASYDAALAVAPDRLDIEINRGTVLLELDRFAEALKSFDKALARDPDNVAALINRGNACIKGKRFADALQSYDSALALDPDQAGALTDRCVALAEMDRFDEALASVDRALGIEPHVVAAHVNRGNALMKLARFPDAIASYEAALKLDPEQVDANFNASLARLCLGDFQAGWKQYEHRWKKKEFRAANILARCGAANRTSQARPSCWCTSRAWATRSSSFVTRRWSPSSARGWWSACSRRSRAWSRPCRAFRRLSPTVKCIPDFDLYCPLLNLPRAFGTELGTIPSQIPYIRPFTEELADWRDRFADDGRVRVGICWAGNSSHLNDRNRSLPLERLTDVLTVDNLDFVSIQKDVSAAQAAFLQAHGVRQLGQEFADFTDTAAVIAMLDLVVAVDTSVAHLAGAMGKGVALLIPYSPDWRWLLGRTDSPWYPTMRIFRQDAVGNWDGPLERLRDELVGVARRGARRP